MQTHITYDWLEDSLLSVCRGVFPDATLRINNLEPKVHRVFPHQEYIFNLSSDDAETDLILRLHHGFFSPWEGSDPLKVTREFSAMRHAYQHGFAAPFPYTYSTTRRPFGRAFILMDAGDGYYWWEREDSLTHMQEHVVDSLAVWMAQLHVNVPVEHPLIPPVYASDIHEKVYNRVAHLHNPVLDRCFSRCREQMEHLEPLPFAMLHGRLDLDCLLINRGQLRSVTNWEFAAFGDPRWDVAYTSLALQYTNDRTLANYFVARYVQEIGTPLEDIAFWEGLVALRSYALSQWLRSLDAKGFEHIAGLQTHLFDQEEFWRERALQQFGE